jgi:formylglycine-generating enzyme required for sulfatase activity
VVFVLIPGGRAFQGAKVRREDPPIGDDVPVDSTLPRSTIFGPFQLDPFLIAKYEMTQAQWARLTGMKPSQHPPDDLGPVDSVTWIETDLWLRRAGMVLPTTFQWKYAARGGAMTRWHTGSERDSLAQYANLAGQEFSANRESPVKNERWNDGYEPPVAVGRFLPNGFGLHDAHGNVFEWSRDSHRTSVYEPRAGDGDNVQVISERFVVLKTQHGGSYRRDASTSLLDYDLPKTIHTRDYETGVRAARSLDP